MPYGSIQKLPEKFVLSKRDSVPLTLWLTGTVVGNTALAKEVEKRLVARGYHTMLIDNSSGESVRQLAAYATLLNDAGLLALVPAGSTNDNDQAIAQEIIGQAFYQSRSLSTALRSRKRQKIS